MSTAYVGEVRIFSFGIVPRGWAQCNGQLLSIAQNQALFSILGTTYGGDGVTTFALPNLQGRAPAHWGPGGTVNGFSPMVIGQVGGEISHTLLVSEMPAHNHIPMSFPLQGTSPAAEGNTWAVSKNAQYSNPAVGGTTQVAMAVDAITTVGGGQPHENMAPYLVLNFCIAIVGIFPSRN